MRPHQRQTVLPAILRYSTCFSCLDLARCSQCSPSCSRTGLTLTKSPAALCSPGKIDCLSRIPHTSAPAHRIALGYNAPLVQAAPPLDCACADCLDAPRPAQRSAHRRHFLARPLQRRISRREGEEGAKKCNDLGAGWLREGMQRPATHALLRLARLCLHVEAWILRDAFERFLCVIVEAASFSTLTIAVVLALCCCCRRRRYQFLISGGVAWGYEFVVGHYLEFLKIVKQTRPGSYWQLTKVRSAMAKGAS